MACPGSEYVSIETEEQLWNGACVFSTPFDARASVCPPRA